MQIRELSDLETELKAQIESLESKIEESNEQKRKSEINLARAMGLLASSTSASSSVAPSSSDPAAVSSTSGAFREPTSRPSYLLATSAEITPSGHNAELLHPKFRLVVILYVKLS